MGGSMSTPHQHYCSNYQVLYEHIFTRFGCPLTIEIDQVFILLMMQLDILLTILSLGILVLLCIIHKEMDRLSLQTRF
jgi:hypothetical protein